MSILSLAMLGMTSNAAVAQLPSRYAPADREQVTAAPPATVMPADFLPAAALSATDSQQKAPPVYSRPLPQGAQAVASDTPAEATISDRGNPGQPNAWASAQSYAQASAQAIVQTSGQMNGPVSSIPYPPTPGVPPEVAAAVARDFAHEAAAVASGPQAFVDSQPQAALPSGAALQSPLGPEALAMRQPVQIAPEVDPLVAPLVDQLPSGVSGFMDEGQSEDFFGGDLIRSGRFTVRPRGRLLGDLITSDQSPMNKLIVGEALNGFAWRQARLGIEGEGYDQFIYQIEMEFAADGRPSFRDAYFAMLEVPLLGTAFVGRMKEPFSLEELPTIEHIPFMERSLANTFVPSRSVGIRNLRASDNERMTWSTGGFLGGADDYGNMISNQFAGAFTGRVTWLPYYDEPSGGRYLFHLGGAMSARVAPQDQVRYRHRPEVQRMLMENGDDGFPFFVNTDNFSADSITLLGTEAALVRGAFSIQSEVIYSQVTRPAGGGAEADFWGGYVQTSWFLTGEHRPYDRQRGHFTRVRPLERFFLAERTDGRLLWGTGAWEAALRVSHVDLDSGPITGGRLTDYTVGLNWYWNPRMRMSFNYIYADLFRDGVDSSANVFGTRFQVSF